MHTIANHNANHNPYGRLWASWRDNLFAAEVDGLWAELGGRRPKRAGARHAPTLTSYRDHLMLRERAHYEERRARLLGR